MKKSIALIEGTDDFNDIKAEWLDRASKATIETLPNFLKEITENYQHDYGTICHAMAIAAIASARAINASPQGGITGFQAGAIMWEFIREWNYSGNKTGLKLVDYDNLLYPQYEDEFEKAISSGVWENLQKEAKANIREANTKYATYLVAKEEYRKEIASFVEKYSDYYENREHYDKLGIGTGDQWEAEEKKMASGFEFAPQEPYEPINNGSNVYQHWQSIVDGVAPFGFKISD